LISLALLDLYRGRYASAKSRLEECAILLNAASRLSQARVHLLLSVVAEGQGNSRKQRQELAAAVDDWKQVQLKVLLGGIVGDMLSRAGEAAQAEKIEAQIRPLADAKNPEEMGYLHLLEGDLALASGQNERAVELLSQSEKENATGFSQEALANAYQRSGNPDKAVTTYEEMFAGVDRGIGWEPQQRWIEARYTLATDYAARGDKAKARETLSALLESWKDADADLPLLKRAKAEYATLQ